MANTHVKRVKTFKYLGLVLDEELSFKHHVDLESKGYVHLYLSCGVVFNTSLQT